MENKIATVVWNEFIAQTANNGINFSFADLEKRIKETLNEALRQPYVSWRSEQLKGDEDRSAEWRGKNLGYGSKGEMIYIK